MVEVGKEPPPVAAAALSAAPGSLTDVGGDAPLALVEGVASAGGSALMALVPEAGSAGVPLSVEDAEPGEDGDAMGSDAAVGAVGAVAPVPAPELAGGSPVDDGEVAGGSAADEEGGGAVDPPEPAPPAEGVVPAEPVLSVVGVDVPEPPELVGVLEDGADGPPAGVAVTVPGVGVGVATVLSAGPRTVCAAGRAGTDASSLSRVVGGAAAR